MIKFVLSAEKVLLALLSMFATAVILIGLEFKKCALIAKRKKSLSTTTNVHLAEIRTYNRKSKMT